MSGSHNLHMCRQDYFTSRCRDSGISLPNWHFVRDMGAHHQEGVAHELRSFRQSQCCVGGCHVWVSTGRWNPSVPAVRSSSTACVPDDHGIMGRSGSSQTEPTRPANSESGLGKLATDSVCNIRRGAACSHISGCL